MRRTNEEFRGFGANVVERLLPQRRPFLFVDRVKRFRLGERRSIEASLQISVNDPVFEGHFPHWSLWPGVFVVEGLGQPAQLLSTLDAIRRTGAERGDEALGFRGLDALDSIYSLGPNAGISDDALGLLKDLASSPVVGLATRIDIRFLEPVLPGCRLDYHVQWAREQNGILAFDVEASVGGKPVARGELGASVDARIPGG